ncbi:MAG: ribosome maturation factor RimP [Myxococcota bacterium]|nr:ribosome maturation factor RimP [Myxococcota bacterium]
MNSQVLRQRELFDVLEPVVEADGYELVAVELTQVSGRLTLRIYADRVGGINMDHLSQLTRTLGPVLDVEDPISGAYQLEVSSPGIERPLQRIEDFARFEGYRARIRLEEGPERRRYSGVLRGLEAKTVRIEVDGQVHDLEFDLIEKANLVLDLDEYQALGTDPPPRVRLDTELNDDQ